jgi:hypothetical protein
MFARAPIADVANFIKHGHLRRSPGFQELNEIDQNAAPCGAYSQTNRPTGLADALSKINMDKTKAFILN